MMIGDMDMIASIKDKHLQDVDFFTESGVWELRYYLRTFGHAHGERTYGLRVDKCYENGTVSETKATYSLTNSRSVAVNLARKFVKGTVPPCVLVEMAHEWVSEIEERLEAVMAVSSLSLAS
jgi:hypothetical protein